MYFAACPQIIAAASGSTSRLKNTSNLPPVTGPSHQATRMRGIFFGQVECCPQPFIRFTQRLYRLFYACYSSREDRNNYEGRLLTFQTVKDLSALFAEYICIISRLFSASSANLTFLKIKRSSEFSDDLFIGTVGNYPWMSANNAFLIELKVL